MTRKLKSTVLPYLFLLLTFGSGFQRLPHHPNLAYGNQAQPSNESIALARNELYQGVCAYHSKDYAKAQQHFEKALELAPTQKNLLIYIARAIHAQYREGLETAENVGKAHAAIAAYEKVLTRDADSVEALSAIPHLYTQIEREDQLRDWLMKRASLETLSKEQRANLYYELASKQFGCSYNITSQNQQTVQRNGKADVQYKKPRNPADFSKAQECARKGVEAVERSLSLDPNNPTAWFYKSLLLLEMGKLAEMENRSGDKAGYDKQAEEAKEAFKKKTEAIRKEETRATEAPAKAEADESQKLVHEIEAARNFIKSGTFRKESDPDLLVEPIERAVTLLDPPPPPSPPGNVSSNERAAKRMAKLPWKQFAPSNEEFTALTPSPISQDSGPNRARRYFVTSEGLDYMIMSLDKSLPPGLSDKDASIPVLDYTSVGIAQAICNFFSGIGGYTCEVKFVRELISTNHPGRHYGVTLTKCSESASGVLRIYVAGKHTYGLWVMGADESDPRVMRFLQSFTLMAKPRTTPNQKASNRH